MAAIENETFWNEFIVLYKSLPELWQVKNERYQKKGLKEKGYRILLKKLREVQPYASETTLKRKLNMLKESYRHELSKVRRSEKFAKTPDEIYKPTQWFFRELSFLAEEDLVLSDTGASDNEDMVMHQKPAASSKDFEKRRSASTQKSSNATEHTHRRQDKELEKNKILKFRRSKTPSDDSHILSATWAALFRKLDPEQQIHANKAIMDILYKGQLSSMDNIIVSKVESTSELFLHSSNDRLTDNLLNEYPWKH